MYTVIYSSFITKYAKFTRRRPKIKPPAFFGLILEPKMQKYYGQWLICDFVFCYSCILFIYLVLKYTYYYYYWRPRPSQVRQRINKSSIKYFRVTPRTPVIRKSFHRIGLKNSPPDNISFLVKYSMYDKFIVIRYA